MEIDSPEVRDIGRFVRARREATDARGYVQLPERRRHVSHLTQGDLAELVGVSTVVISQIEQGRYPNLTHGILTRIARSLHFTKQQEVYLFGLLEPRPEYQRGLEPAPEWVTKSISLAEHPAAVINPAYDVVAINRKTLALFANLSPEFAPKRNSAYSIFNLPGVREFIDDWPAYVASLVSGLKISYAMFPSYRNYIDDLSIRLRESNPIFGGLWDQDDPLVKPTIEKNFNHPEYGQLTVMQILTDMVEEPTLTKVEFFPADDATGEALKKL